MNYSEPKIFTGGVDISAWSKLSLKEKKEALSKKWYIYYLFRDPKTGKLKRQTNIKAGANLYKDKKSRYHILSKLKESLKYILSEGFNPYKDNSSLATFIEQLLSDDEKKDKKIEKVVEKPILIEKIEPISPIYSIKKAFNLALTIKSKVQAENLYANFKGRVSRFLTWLEEENILLESDIIIISKKNVIHKKVSLKCNAIRFA